MRPAMMVVTVLSCAAVPAPARAQDDEQLCSCAGADETPAEREARRTLLAGVGIFSFSFGFATGFAESQPHRNYLIGALPVVGAINAAIHEPPSSGMTWALVMAASAQAFGGLLAVLSAVELHEAHLPFAVAVQPLPGGAGFAAGASF